jgi:hypothetical protein
MMESVNASETLLGFYQATRSNVQDYSNFYDVWMNNTSVLYSLLGEQI